MSARQKRRRDQRRRRAAARSRRRNRALVGAGITMGASLAGPAAAEADTFTVTNLRDDGSPGTLRNAIADAQATPGFDRVLFDSGLSGTITLQTAQGGDIEINYPTEIVGPGPGRVTVDGNGDTRIFDIYGPGPFGQIYTKVTISGLTLTGGSTGGDGGAIRSESAELTVLDSVISGNATGGTGGGIGGYFTNLRLDSTVVSGNAADDGGGVGLTYGTESNINDSTISGNYAAYHGGGVLGVIASSLLITGSTISGNTADDDDGGGVYSLVTDTTIANSTISGNTAEDGGGLSSVDYGAPYSSKLTTRNSTIARNSASDDGGGIDADGYMHVLLQNSIVATNTAATSGPNIDNRPPNEPVEAAFTLIDDPTDAQITETTPGSNVIGLNPQLGPLADNGGPTQTMALSNTSPALDAGDGFGSRQDQRSRTRPIELPGIPNSTAAGGDGSDIGAFELQGIVQPAAAAAAQLECRGKPATIVAQPGVITRGTNEDDVIVGTDGVDEIRGRAGKDLICGWDGEDRLFGGKGNDTVFGQRDDDFAKGQDGRDRLGGGPGEDKLLGGDGRDGLTGGRGPDTLIGGDALDRLFGKAGRDRMFGNDGPDRLFGGPAADRFDGGPGRNILHLIRGDGDEVVGQNATEVVLISDRAKRKQP